MKEPGGRTFNDDGQSTMIMMMRMMITMMMRMIVIVAHCFLAISQRGKQFDYNDWDGADDENDDDDVTHCFLAISQRGRNFDYSD